MALTESPWIGTTEDDQHCRYCSGEPGYRPILDRHDDDCPWAYAKAVEAERDQLLAVQDERDAAVDAAQEERDRLKDAVDLDGPSTDEWQAMLNKLAAENVALREALGEQHRALGVAVKLMDKLIVAGIGEDEPYHQDWTRLLDISDRPLTDPQPAVARIQAQVQAAERRREYPCTLPEGDPEQRGHRWVTEVGIYTRSGDRKQGDQQHYEMVNTDTNTVSSHYVHCDDCGLRAEQQDWRPV